MARGTVPANGAEIYRPSCAVARHCRRDARRASVWRTSMEVAGPDRESFDFVTQVGDASDDDVNHPFAVF